MKKQVTAFILVCMIVFSAGNFTYAENDNSKKKQNTDKTETTEESAEKAPEEVLEATSPHAILVDIDTGAVIYEKNAREVVYPAALTNIMTAVLVLENCNLEEVVTARETALSNVKSGDNKMGIVKDEKLSVRQLLYAMLLESSSDAANVLAEKTSGSIEEFVKLMNSKAQSLGMKNTNFTNPTGNHDDRHYTTAADMAILSCYAMQIPEFCDIVKSDSYNIPATEKTSTSRKITNRNHLVSRLLRNDYYYQYANGLKSGYGTEAKSCIAASAKKDSMFLLALVFEADTKDNVAQSYTDCKNMFEYVFEHYVSDVVIKEGEIAAQTNITNTRRDNKLILKSARNVSVIRHSEDEDIKISYKDTLAKSVSAPVKKNQKIGSRQYFVNGEAICQIDLLAEKNYTLDPITYIINKLVAFFTSPWLYICLIGLLFIFIMAERRRRRILRKKRREARRKRNMELINMIDK